MERVNNFLISKIERKAKKVKIKAIVNDIPRAFNVEFNDSNGHLGFIFQSDLEMLCRANEISLAHNLMEILERVYQNEPLSFPMVVFSNVQQLQVA